MVKEHHGLDRCMRQYLHARKGTEGAANTISANTSTAQREWMRDEYGWNKPFTKGKGNRTHFFEEPRTPDYIVKNIFKKDMKQKGKTPRNFRETYIAQAQNMLEYIQDKKPTHEQGVAFTGEYDFGKEISEFITHVRTDQEILGEEYDYDNLENIVAQIHQGIQKHRG